MDNEKEYNLEKIKLKITICDGLLNRASDDLRFAKSQLWSYLYFTILAMSAIIYVGTLEDAYICVDFINIILLFIGFFGMLTISIHYYSMGRYRSFGREILNEIEDIYLYANNAIEDEINNTKAGFKIKDFIYECTRGSMFYYIFMILILMALLLSLVILKSEMNYLIIILGWFLVLMVFNLFLKPIILFSKPEKIFFEDKK